MARTGGRVEKLIQVEASLADFTLAMQGKLDENVHKAHWLNTDYTYLTMRLVQELGELMDALFDNEPVEEVVKEAADVANFAMMIADKARGCPHGENRKVRAALPPEDS